MTHGSPELDEDAAKLEAMGQDPGPTVEELDLFKMSEADALRHFLRRIEEETRIPAEKRCDLAWLQSATSLAHIYAKAGLSAFDSGCRSTEDQSTSGDGSTHEIDRLTRLVAEGEEALEQASIELQEAANIIAGSGLPSAATLFSTAATRAAEVRQRIKG